MISVEEAKNKIIEYTTALTRSIQIPTEQAYGYTLSEDIISPIDLPLFSQSAVDGYFIPENSFSSSEWKVAGEIKAGDDPDHYQLKTNECVRIFTGAGVPEIKGGVVMQEFTKELNAVLTLQNNHTVKLHDNIRYQATQIKKGELALTKNSTINPAMVGFIAAMGIAKIPVFDQPKINVLITGNELVKPGEPIRQKGFTFESNSQMITAAIQSLRVDVSHINRVKDDETSTIELIKESLKTSDVLLITGGISVGKYDFVKAALEANGVKTIFHKIAQKPGKPLYFGVKGEQLIFALPGNPASVLVCFYEYVYPALKKLIRANNYSLESKKLVIQNDFKKKPGLANFLKAKVDDSGQKVTLLEGQESFILKSFAEANALIYLSPETESVKAGSLVETHILPD